MLMMCRLLYVCLCELVHHDGLFPIKAHILFLGFDDRVFGSVN